MNAFIAQDVAVMLMMMVMLTPRMDVAVVTMMITTMRKMTNHEEF